MRMTFDAADALNTHVVSVPAPLIELSLALSRSRRATSRLDGWASHVGHRLPPDTRHLAALTLPDGAGALFLDPVSATVDVALAAVHASEPSVVASEIERVVAAQPSRAVGPFLPALRALSRFDGRSRTALTGALRGAHDALIAPVWERMQASVRTELAVRGQAFAEQGIRSIADLFPGAAWDGDTLVVPGSDRHITLGGLGLRLLPSTTWTGSPLITAADGRVVVVYRAALPFGLIETTGAGGSLGALIGRSRAAVLLGASESSSTGRLARRTGLSAASTSEHAAVLRRAGLLTTRRTGKGVEHTTTPLGRAILAATSG